MPCFGRAMASPRLKRLGRFTARLMNYGFLTALLVQKRSLKRFASVSVSPSVKSATHFYDRSVSARMRIQSPGRRVHALGAQPALA